MQFRKHVTKLGTAVAGRGKLAAAAIIAVGLAVGGSVAADAAGSPSIPDGSIYHIDIHDGAVGSDTIANRSIQSYDMDKALVNALLAVPDGSVTEKDLDPKLKAKVNQVGTGKQGPQGPAGKDGVSGYEVVGRTADRMTLAAGETKTVTTLCAEGTVAIGGGGDAAGAGASKVLINSTVPGAIKQVGPKTEQDPAGVWAATGWKVTATNIGDAAATVQPFVTCAEIG